LTRKTAKKTKTKREIEKKRGKTNKPKGNPVERSVYLGKKIIRNNVSTTSFIAISSTVNK